ncbi:hypothetical protein ABZV77_03910 [Streptomyces sp. NPDC004732]|uniref:hypothetical protein n=1 Tax=Streptomyces sp. NPDC004732 TaxID=3154290 RepID=UPI0033B5243A
MAAAETVKEDTLVVREDLGPESFTLVVAGDAVPAHLLALPRVPRASVPQASKRKALRVE